MSRVRFLDGCTEPESSRGGADGAGRIGAPATALDPELLLRFYAEHARDLPWRGGAATPWSVLVSEIMLQQTPVARVIPVFRSWMERWPDPPALAAASRADVLRAWDRLGYPRRALRLHDAAVAITAQHAGVVPASVESLLELPGIGDYTARAVAAFAYGARAPVVDTNVRRVMSRAIRGVDEPGASATAADRALMESLLPTEHATAARFSIAVMELGALRCTAARPRCEHCPIAARCAWLAAGRPAGDRVAPVQRWHGTDRQVRGRIMAALRDRAGPIEANDVRAAATDPGQLDRCIDALVGDGLVRRVGRTRLALPG